MVETACPDEVVGRGRGKVGFRLGDVDAANDVKELDTVAVRMAQDKVSCDSDPTAQGVAQAIGRLTSRS